MSEKDINEIVNEIYKLGKFKSKNIPGRLEKYENIHFGYLEFNEPITYKERKFIGIHIMPYRITKDDIKKAYKNDSKIKSYPKAVDFDSDSGNFHKIPDGEFQIVLIRDGLKYHGPGRPKKRMSYINDIIREDIAELIIEENNDLYMPTLKGEGYTGNDVKKLVENLLSKIKK